MNLPLITAAMSLYNTMTQLNSLYLAMATGGPP